MTGPRHIPVMCSEVVAAAQPADGALLVDATFGAGGYTVALLTAAECRVIGLDRDPSAITEGQELVDAYAGRLILQQGCFGNLEAHLETLGIGGIDGLVLDLGVSSMQLDRAERGFAFQQDGPLDMRMGSSDETAADVVNTYEEAKLADIVFHLGEEPKARRVARALVERRAERPFSRTLDLAAVVVEAVGHGMTARKRHPATRTFQALRLHVNRELEELDRVLVAAEQRLKPGGRLVVVSFHSLEDRRVKRFLAARAGRTPAPSRHRPVAEHGPAPSFRLPSSGAVKPGQEEITANPRARSARLRLGIRTDAPAWSTQKETR